MKTATQLTNIPAILKNTVAAVTMLLGATTLQAEPLQANTIYVTTGSGLYAVNESNSTASQVATANPSLSQIEDLAFDDGELYGLTSLMQFFQFDAASNAMLASNDFTSYGLNHRGLEARNGVFYAAEQHGLQIADPHTGSFTEIGPYGLGAGERVTDLAFDSNGVLYAAVSFNIVYGSEYLATLNTATGEMNIIGNTFISGLRGLTEKDGVLYGISSTGDLYTIDKLSGQGTLLADGLVPGAYGMTTSPASLGNNGTGAGTDPGTAAAGDSSSGGALSLPLMLLMTALLVFRAGHKNRRQ